MMRLALRLFVLWRHYLEFPKPVPHQTFSGCLRALTTLAEQDDSFVWTLLGNTKQTREMPNDRGEDVTFNM